MFTSARKFVAANIGAVISYVIGLLFSAVARFIPSALDRALKGLNGVEALLAKAATDAKAKLEAEAARRDALLDQIDLSWDATDLHREVLNRADRVRSRINDLLA